MSPIFTLRRIITNSDYIPDFYQITIDGEALGEAIPSTDLDTALKILRWCKTTAIVHPDDWSDDCNGGE